MRFAVDTGGTFTDLIVEDDDGGLHMFKAATTPDDPIRGVINSLENAAAGLNTELASLLGQGDFIVAEADESDGSFLKMSPTKNQERIKEGFIFDYPYTSFKA